MKKNLIKSFSTAHENYLNKTFREIKVSFKNGAKILDVGCGDGTYMEVFSEIFKLKTYGIDIYKDEKIDKIKNISFKKGSIYKIAYKNEYFDYVFLHDVLHHIDEKDQSLANHRKAMNEIKRVTKKGGQVIIVEANRFNPLFYPHMVLMRKHNHWRQSYFEKLIRESFPKENYSVRLDYFEAHFYPFGNRFWNIYEYLMELIPFKKFHAYNVCIATRNK